MLRDMEQGRDFYDDNNDSSLKRFTDNAAEHIFLWGKDNESMK